MAEKEYNIFRHVFIGVKSPENTNCCVFIALEWPFYTVPTRLTFFFSVTFLHPEGTNKLNTSTEEELLCFHKLRIRCMFSNMLEREWLAGDLCWLWSVTSPLDATKSCILDHQREILKCNSILLWKKNQVVLL